MPAGNSCGSSQWLGSGQAGPLRMGQTENCAKDAKADFSLFLCLKPGKDVARKLSRMHAKTPEVLRSSTALEAPLPRRRTDELLCRHGSTRDHGIKTGSRTFPQALYRSSGAPPLTAP